MPRVRMELSPEEQLLILKRRAQQAGTEGWNSALDAVEIVLRGPTLFDDPHLTVEGILRELAPLRKSESSS